MRALCKSFRAPTGDVIEVLRDVSFSVEAGEMVGVMGASGAGKSTLLHLLGGLEAADGGEIRLGDFNITHAEGAELARYRSRDVGFVFQFHHLLPDLTAVENVALPLMMQRARKRDSMTRATCALEAVGLSKRARHPVGHLSGGEQQRVALARALVTQPRLVLADEPTGNLDAAISDEIGAMLASFCRAQGAAAVIATHNKRLAQTCDRILILQEGKMKQDGNRPVSGF